MTQRLVKSITISKRIGPCGPETRIELETQRAILGAVMAEERVMGRHMAPEDRAHYAEYLARDTASTMASMLRREIEDVLVRYTPVVKQGECVVYSRT